MDDRVKAAAQGALRRLGTGSLGAAVSQALPQSGRGALRLGTLTLAQLSNLAYLQAEDPVVQQVLEALRSGRPVYLDRPAVERALDLPSYPPRMQEQFARWFSRISGYGIHLTGEAEPLRAATPAVTAPPAPPPPKAPAPPPATLAEAESPERQVLADILGQTCPSGSPCVLEPTKGCCGSGRCKSLGF